jgi:hypothetical protein
MEKDAENEENFGMAWTCLFSDGFGNAVRTADLIWKFHFELSVIQLRAIRTFRAGWSDRRQKSEDSRVRNNQHGW